MEQSNLTPFSHFFYDLYGYYSYVMINGSEQTVDKVVKFLQQNGINCTLKGKSRRRASNGLSYDWYVRIVDSANSKPAKETVESILYEYFGIIPIEKQIGEFETKIAEYQREVEDLQAKIQKELQSQDEVLSSVITSEERANLLQEQNNDLLKQIESYKQIVTTQQEQIAYLDKLRVQVVDNTSYKTYEDILHAIFPDMEFVQNTLDYLFMEAEDRDWALRTLVRVYTNDKYLKSKRFESVSANGKKIWFEVDYGGFSRMYYARVGNKVHVFIDRKREQVHAQNILSNYSNQIF